MRKLNRKPSKILFSGLLILLSLLVGSCESWMSNDNFMEQIESEVHDANASQVSVYVRYANARWGTTEPQGNVTMKVDVASKISAVTSDEYGFVKWAAFSTKDFPINKQHSNLVFISEKNYETNYKGKELPDTVVRFADPKNPNTTVTIYSTSNDLFIVPIVTRRPEFESSNPVENDKVVKNTSIEIYFTKSIDAESLKDEEGNLNFNVTSRSFMRRNDDEVDEDDIDDDESSSGEDITDYFNYALQRNGKCLKLTLKEGKILDNNQNVTVTLHEGLRDKYGFEMNGNAKFAFKTGTKSDSLAPIIQVLMGGNGNVRLGDFNSYHNTAGELEGTATKASANAPRDIESEEYTPAIVAQRVYDKLYLYVRSVDIIGADSNLTLDDKNQQEENVGYIGISASLYIENTDNNNNPVTKDSDKLDRFIAKTNNVYIPDSIDSKADTSGLFTEIFRDVVPLEDKNDPKSGYSGGEIFSYDVSKLPDGLIKIDVWGIDITGNSGDDLNKGAIFYDKYDNGYKSIFVVKDTTAPDSTNESKKLKSKSDAAPYYWYNKSTLNSMKLFDEDNNQIVDSGHPKLRSLTKNLMWNFVVGKSTTAPKADDSGWKYIHNTETGASEKYSLGNAEAPEKDGPVDVTLYIRDDLGNVSDPVVLDSIMYDNTKPTVSLLDNYGDFVKAEDGEKTLHSSKDAVISQVLKVSFTEPNIDNAGSGIRRIEIHVKKGDKEVAVPLDKTFKVTWAPESVSNPTPATAEEIAIAEDDIASDDTLKVFNVTDAKKITTGTLFIYGITLGDEDGDYTVNVDLFDSALNKTPATATTLISRDTTAPVINKVNVVSAIARSVYGDATEEKTWWLPENQFETAADGSKELTKVTLVVTANESGSGLEKIKVANDVELTAATKLKKGAEYLIPETDYQLDFASNTINLLDNYKAKLKNTSTSPIEFTLENVKLKTINSSAANKVNVAVTDFVSNTGSNLKEGTTSDYQIYYDDTTSGTLIYADNTPPVITDLRIEDSAQNAYNNLDTKGYNNKYTDTQKVVLLLTLKAEKLTDGSGVKTITLSENASFSADTEIFVDGVKLTEGYSELHDGDTSVTFDKVFVEANNIKFTNVNIRDNTDGEQTVKADLTDFVGLQTVASKESDVIILDQRSPVINNIEWENLEGGDVALGLSSHEIITNQNFKVDFTEATAGTKVIRFDINHENDAENAPSYATPFDDNLVLTYNNETLTNNSDYTIENGRYIVLKDPLKSGTLRLDNIKLNNTTVEGQYNIKVTMLDAAENKNPQPLQETENVVYNKVISVDKTSPVVNKVLVLDAEARTVYNDASAVKTWWMPNSKFIPDAEGNNLPSKVSLKITASEVGSGIKVIKLANDVEFTPDSKIKTSKGYLVAEKDYHLDQANNTITLFNYEEPKLKGTSNAPATDFTLENVELKKINTDDGNAINVQVIDFVDWDGSNVDGSNYKIYYPGEIVAGTKLYADNTAPSIDTLSVSDAETRTHPATDSDVTLANKAHKPAVYTDSNNITLTLKLVAESLSSGSGVNKIQLSSNAEFTNDTTISVDGSPLSNGFSFESDNKTVLFNNVFVADNTITFTNVKILGTTNGAQPITATVTDFTGWESLVKTNDNTIILDTVNPLVGNPVWVVDQVAAGAVPNTEGITNGNVIDNQTLEVPFTEATSGIKVIKMDVLYENESDSYATPFADSGLVIKYVAGTTTTTLTKDRDYTIDSDGHYIILTDETKYKSNGANKFTFHGIKIRDASAEGTYTIKVTLQDAAERIATNEQTIAIDTVRPEIIDNELRIHGLIHSVELTTSSSNPETYWLPKEMVNNTSTSYKAPDAIPLYFTINESGSGIKVIQFSPDVLLSTANTKLYLVADGATEATETTAAHTEIPSSAYDINVSARTITINTKELAKEYMSKDASYTVLVDNVGFKNADSTTGVSKNSIKVTVSDVAKNASDEAVITEVANADSYIYSDSMAPAAPTSFILKDRGDSSPSGTISASTGYTNESIVDMTFNLSASEQYGSGYHKFTLTGAKFKSTSDVTNASDATILTMKNGSTAITGLSYEIEDEGRTLVIKKSGAAAELKAVIKQAVSVTINNVHLDNPTTQSQHTVTLTANDLTGLASSSTTSTIKLDTTEPELKGGSPFTANYTSGPAYYNPAVNVYPHANGETGYGVEVTSGTETIYTFYTATTYETGYYQYNGVVSEKSSTAASEPDTIFTHGAVLGFHAKDNLMLRASQGTSYYYMRYIADPNFNKSKADIISNGTYLRPDSSAKVQNSAESNKTAYDYTLWYKFATGKYSAVILDAAGNVSDVFRFAVVQDTKKPDTDIQNRVLLQRPDESYNIYRNAETVTGTSSDFSSYTAYEPSSNSDPIKNKPIRTKKYVTKQASEKYKIVLNLGSTYSNSSLVSKLSGESVSSVLEYAELKGTLESSPIEQYVISTWYGSWPTDNGTSTESSSLPYIPVPPYKTTFPSGQLLDARSANDSYAQTGIKYFGGDDSFKSYWNIENGKANWHSAKYNSGTKYTDTGNGIVSYIDENNNLIIEVPNNRSTAPISVFLRDGCGNMDFVVLGLEKSDVDDKETAVSIILDNKLGGVTTTNGRAGKLQVMQNPFVSTSQHVSDKTDGPTWTVNGYSPKYYWNLQSGNGDAGRDDATKTEHGVGDMYGFFKDKTLGATYYNPRISVSSNTITQLTDTSRDKAYWTKLGLTFRWHDKDDDTALESAMFTSNINKAIQNTDLAGSNTAYDYTCRALLYCTTDSTEPSYDKIVKSHIEGRTGTDAIRSGDKGFRTEWVGARASGTGNSLTILIDYPQPDYDLLGWTVNNSSLEPVPYYIWYIFEDRVGNYELAKVVNSSFDDDGAIGANDRFMDKWLYDGKAPEVTVIGTTKKPNEIINDADEVKALVSDNNGYVPYLDTTNKRIWVSSDQDRTSRSSSLIKSPSGWGVTNKVENGTSLVKNREYLPFANLTVSKEITGIRAFAWSTSLTPPAINKVLSTDNTQGDRYDATEYPYGAWYAGSGASTTATDIGWTYSYTNSENRYLATTKYADKYSGTKINTIIPQNLISTSSDTELYLHVMDWTGNIATYRMGSVDSGLKFKNDISSPSYTSNTSAIYHPENEHYDVRYESGYITVRIANTTENVKVRFKNPTNGKQLYYSDDSSDYAGFSFADFDVDTNGNKLNIGRDTDGPYLLIPSTTYNTDAWKSGTTKTVYFYDNVGNTTSRSIKFIYDTVAPKLTGLTLNLASGGIIADEDGATKATDTPKSYSFTENASEDLTPDSAEFSCKEVYVNEDKKVKIGITLDSTTTDFDHFEISKWNRTEWVKTSSLATGSKSDTSTDSLKFADNETSAFFKITAYDYSGNAGCQYLHLILDKTAPTITTDPVITLGKGSINNIGETYYYTADAEKPLIVTFAVEDNGVGVKNSTYEYSTDGTNYTTIDDNSKVEIKYTSGDVYKIWLKDCLGNAEEYTPKFKYTYNYIYSWIETSTETVNDGQGGTYEVTKEELHEEERSETKENIPSLSFRDGTAPAAPTFNYSEARDLVQTYGVTDKEWRNSFIEKLTLKEKDQDGNYVLVDYVLIKNKDESKIKIKFTPAADSKIIGYVTNTSDAVGAYNFGHGGIGTKDNSGAIWVETDISEISRDNAFTVDYYAVDVVGNVSTTPLSVRYTFDNPHAAKNVTLIRDPLTSTEIPEDVRTEMEKDNLNFASFWDKAGDVNDKKGITWFSDGYLVIKCTLYQKPGDDYSETPTKVTLHDKYLNGWYDPPREESPERGVSDTGESFKYYTSSGDTEKDASGRYYCWIAFKLKNFDNNDSGNTDYGGSKIHASVHGKESKSDLTILNPTETQGYGWKRDVTAPEITNGNGKTYLSNNVLTNYDTNTGKSMALVYDQDNDKGGDYVTVAYDRGLKIYIRADNISDKDTDNKKTGFDQYRFDYNGSSNDWNNLKTVTSKGTTYYEFALPGVESLHSNLILMLKDKVGNVSSYKLAHTGKTESYRYVWWIANDILTTEGANPAAKIEAQKGFEQTDESYTFDVTLPYGSIIKSVKAKVGKQNDYNEIAISELKFNDYKGSSVTLDGNKGWLNVKGLTVTLPKIEQKWYKQDVQIIINGDNSKPLTVTDFVPAFTLTKDYIETQVATWELNKRSGYEVYVTVKNGPTANNISGITAKNAKVDTWTVVEGTDNKTVKVTLKDVVAQDWGKAQNVTLRINDSFDTDPVLNVPQIASEHIGINTLTWDDGTDVEGQEGFRKFTAELTIPNGASAVTGLSVSNATLISSNIASSPVKAEFKANKDWTQKPIRLQITGDTNNGSSTSSVTVAKEVLKLDELTKADLSITVNPNGYVKDTTEYELTVNVPANVAIPDNTETATYISAGNATIAKLSEDSVNKYKLTVAPDWDEKPVTVTVQNFEPFSIFTIDAISKEDIAIKQNGNKPAYDAETTEYVLTISVPGNATLTQDDIVVSPSTTEVGKCSASGSWTPESKEYTLTVTPGWENKKVYLNIKQLGDIEVFEVTKRPFTSEDFELGNASPVAGEEGKYTIPVNLKNGAPASEITNVTGDYGVKASWDSNTVTVWDLPSATWNDQTITLTFNADADGKNGIDKVTDIIVHAKPLQVGDFELGIATKQDNGSYTIDVNFNANVPATALKKVATDVEGVTGVFEKTSAEGVTPETGTITLTGVPKASWTNEYKIKLVINEGDAQFTIEDPVIVIEKKVLTEVTVTKADGANSNWCQFTIEVPDGVTISELVLKDGVDFTLSKDEQNENTWTASAKNIEGGQQLTIPNGEVLIVKTSNGNVPITLFEAPSNPDGNGSQSNDSGNTSSRAGFFSGLISRITGASSESSYTPVETDKTRSITIPNWVTDDLKSSDVADKVNESSSAVTKKAAKKTKKAQKAAKSVKTPVEQPIASETVESVAVISAATLGDVVETVTETAVEVSASADTTETSVIADTVEPSAAMNIPVYEEPLTEAEVEASESRALIWTFIALIAAALVTAAAVLYTRRRK